MRTAIIAALLAVPAPALAGPCEVTITRAPDDVRAAIEQWVAAEPSCGTTAEVRVVATDGGYYLIAIEPDGTVHERVVPDATSAGVLVASWLADDSTGAAVPPAPAAPPEAVAEPTPAPTPAPVAEVAAPGVTVPVVVTAATPPRREPSRSFMLGATIDANNAETAGIRAQVDLMRRGRFRLGVVGAASTAHEPGVYQHSDFRALVEGSYTRTRGPWSLRLGAGLGPRLLETEDYWVGMTTGVIVPVGEVSALVARDLWRRWSVAAGPVLSQNFGDQSDADPDVTLFGALRHPF